MQNKNIIVGNWKMNLTAKTAISLIKKIKSSLSRTDLNNCNVIVCPSFVHLQIVQKELIKNIALGCQNIFWEREGAYTGEISTKMAKNLKCKYAIIGHSERRNILNETDVMINKKIKQCQQESIIPILCVGERQEERQSGHTNRILKNQLLKAYHEINLTKFKEVIVAYEPIWAIGTKNPSSPIDANDAAIFIKEVIARNKRIKIENIKVLYGGSVDSHNISNFLNEEFIDGSLVGGASIKASSFTRIIKNSHK